MEAIFIHFSCVLILNTSCVFDVSAFKTETSSFVADNMLTIIFSYSAFLVSNKSVNNPGATDNRTPESSNFLINLASFIPIGRFMLLPCGGALLFTRRPSSCVQFQDGFFVVIRARTMHRIQICGLWRGCFCGRQHH